MTQKQCIVVAHIANLTGYLNNSLVGPDGRPQKYRIDYQQLLNYVAGDRPILKAIVVSQRDILSNRSEGEVKANTKFLTSLKRFGWDSLTVEFNSQSRDMVGIINTIWSAVCTELHDENGELKVDPSDIDIVFITGSQLWGTMINTFFTAGFNVEVAYPKKSTSKLLYGNFAFLDLTSFISFSNESIINKTAVKV